MSRPRQSHSGPLIEDKSSVESRTVSRAWGWGTCCKQSVSQYRPFSFRIPIFVASASFAIFFMSFFFTYSYVENNRHPYETPQKYPRQLEKMPVCKHLCIFLRICAWKNLLQTFYRFRNNQLSSY